MKKLVFLQMMVTGMMVISSFAMNPLAGDVQKAYQLRMNGKVDEAKTMLDNILAGDSTNAMAHYEKARLMLYMFIGSGNPDLDEIYSSIDKATTYDRTNVTYAYFKGIINFMKAFMGMQRGQQDKVKDYIEETCIQFEKVINIKPDYCEPMLYLVEIYGMLPREMGGGDSLKARAWADKLASVDRYFGARAEAVLVPEGTDLLKFWENEIAAMGRAPMLLIQAGNACLFADEPAIAQQYYEEAMKSDPANNYLLLNLARYHMYKVMQNRDLAAVELPISKKYLEGYLATAPEPVVPFKAYAKGLLSTFEMFLGNQSEAEKLKEEAKALDKYFSRASGIPNQLLFDPPDKICHHYFSFFSPY